MGIYARMALGSIRMRLDKAVWTRETWQVSVGLKPEGMELFSNPIFLSAIFSLLIAQFLKAVVNIFRSKARSFREVLLTFFWKTGGMPSSHSALAVAIATSIAIREGFNTSIFYTCAVFLSRRGARRAGRPSRRRYARPRRSIR